MIRDEYYSSTENLPIGSVVSIIRGTLQAWRISERSGVVLGKADNLYRVRVQGRAFANATLRSDIVSRFRALTDDEKPQTGIFDADARFLPGNGYKIDVVPNIVSGEEGSATDTLSVWNPLRPPAIETTESESFKLASLDERGQLRILLRVEDLNLLRDASWSYFKQETLSGDLLWQKHSIIDSAKDYQKAIANIKGKYSGSAGSIEIIPITGLV